MTFTKRTLRQYRCGIATGMPIFMIRENLMEALLSYIRQTDVAGAI